MTDQKCCDSGDKCGHDYKGGHGMIMECCQEHKMSKEHLVMKKKMLEEKLKRVNEELGKK